MSGFEKVKNPLFWRVFLLSLLPESQLSLCIEIAKPENLFNQIMKG